jgi:3-hydroxybutyrate dehydrogenase
MNVMLNGFGDPSQIESVRSGLAARYGVNVLYHPADLTRPAEIRDFVAAGIEAFGQIDIVVNNAGVQHVQPIEDFPDEKWDQIIAVDLSSAFHMIKHTIGGMKARRWGRIINIASAHGLVASPYKPAYVAAKHGLIGLTKAVALGSAEHGVTCNALCPGYVLTPLVKAQIPDQAKSRGISEDEVVRTVLLASQATKQFVEVSQLAAFAVFLCTDAAAQITGAALPMDGGWTAQ